MDFSQVLLNYLKDEKIKSNLNPIVYYSIKGHYSSQFRKRSRYFCKSLKQFFESLGNTLEISLFDESAIEQKADKTYMEPEGNTTIMIDLNNGLASTQNKNQFNDNLNISLNKNYFCNMSDIFSNDKNWLFKILQESDEEYILDKDEDYILLRLMKNYLFSDENPNTSQLLLSYNIYVSSLELIYCMKLAENFPKVIFNPREFQKFEDLRLNLNTRIRLFYGSWSKFYKNKYYKNIIIRELIGNRALQMDENNANLDLISLSMVEPLLNSKYTSFTKLIREGPFCFEIEEAARQICIIDHEYFSSIKKEDYDKFINKREVPESFNKFNIRDKQIKCYILNFIEMHNNLENKKNMIQNFISLAQTCKLLQNEQTSYTIISAFNIVGLSRKKLLWKLIEKKYREIFSNLEKEFNEFEINEGHLNQQIKFNLPHVPHISVIKNHVNNLIIKIKSNDNINVSSVICKDYKDFCLHMEEISQNKYSFFKVNPLYDFFKFGFLEIFKPKKWNLKHSSRKDTSQIDLNDINQLDGILEYLIDNFKKLDN